MIESEFDFSRFALPTSAAGPRRGELGQGEFLELMIAQIQNQDPFEPMENGAFVGQLAQFSTVTGIAEMSQSVAALSDTLLANQTMQASTMVGRSVLVESPRAVLGSEGPMSGTVELPIDAASAAIRITDSAGQLVREFTVNGTPGGLVEFEWDGVTRTGEQAAPGRYELNASSNNGNAEIHVPTFAHVRVISISIDPSGTGSLITTEDGQQLPLSQVRAIK